MNKNINKYYLTSAALSAFILLVHFFAGGDSIAKPFLENVNITDEVKFVQYFCWHIATLSILFLAVSFAYCAWNSRNVAMAVSTTAFTGSISILGIVMAPLVGISYELMPQGFLFVPMTILGFMGIRKAKK